MSAPNFEGSELEFQKSFKLKTVLGQGKGTKVPREYAYLIQKNGVAGRPGNSPQAPKNQNHGHNGTENHPDGENGEPGLNGYHGTAGHHGQNAQDVEMRLMGSEQALHIAVKKGKAVDLDMTTNQNRNKVILVEAIGGKGGNGGSGSNAGKPGNGGNGWEAPIDSGKKSGRGGNGGQGASGGSAGAPGDGGNGGDITITSTDPRLFVFVESKNHGGSSGKRGQPGFGSKGGRAGSSSVQAGQAGRNGSDGAKANHGKKGQDGKTLFQTVSEHGHVIESGSKLFHPTILSFDICALGRDDIIEPGEMFLLNNFIVKNEGDLTLPAGCNLYVQTSKDITISNMISLPEVLPGQTVAISDFIVGTVNPDLERIDLSAPLIADLDIEARVSCLGRDFAGCSAAGQVTIQHPIQIGSIFSPRCVGRGDSFRLSLFLNNVSNQGYGNHLSQKDLVGYKISVAKHLHFNHSMTLKALDGNCAEVHSNQQWSQDFELTLDYESSFFQSLPFTVELYLRGQLIERRVMEVKCAPHFEVKNTEFTDLLFVTSSLMSKAEFEAYANIFELLKLRVNYWDIDLNQGFSYNNLGTRHRPSWINHYQNKMILFPINVVSSAPDQPAESMKFVESLFSNIDILSHFEQDSQDNGHQPSLLFVRYDNSKPIHDSREVLKYLSVVKSVVRDVKPAELEESYRFQTPTHKDFIAKCQEIEEEINSKNPLYRHYVDAKYELQEKSKSLLSGTLYRYADGGKLHRIGINKLDRLMTCNLPKKSEFELSVHQTHFQTENDPAFSIMFSLLHCMSLQSKFKLINQLSEKGDEIIRTKKKTSHTLLSLVQASVYSDIRREFDLTASHQRLKYLMTLFEEPEYRTYSCLYAFFMSMVSKSSKSWIETLTPSWFSSTKQKKIGLESFLNQSLKTLQQKISKVEHHLPGPNLDQCLEECKKNKDSFRAFYHECRQSSQTEYVL